MKVVKERQAHVVAESGREKMISPVQLAGHEQEWQKYIYIYIYIQRLIHTMLKVLTIHGVEKSQTPACFENNVKNSSAFMPS